jgi:hypothetical protein
MSAPNSKFNEADDDGMFKVGNRIRPTGKIGDGFEYEVLSCKREDNQWDWTRIMMVVSPDLVKYPVPGPVHSVTIHLKNSEFQLVVSK